MISISAVCDIIYSKKRCPAEKPAGHQAFGAFLTRFCPSNRLAFLEMSFGNFRPVRGLELSRLPLLGEIYRDWTGKFTPICKRCVSPYRYIAHILAEVLEIRPRLYLFIKGKMSLACHVGTTSPIYVAPGDLRTPETDDLYHTGQCLSPKRSENT